MRNNAKCRKPRIPKAPLPSVRIKQKGRPIERRSVESVNSDGVLAHLLCDVVGLTNGKRDNRQGRVLGAAGRELAAVGYEQILDVVSLAEFVADAIPRILRHPAGAEIMRR